MKQLLEEKPEGEDINDTSTLCPTAPKKSKKSGKSQVGLENECGETSFDMSGSSEEIFADESVKIIVNFILLQKHSST
jgi:hypothetical protein